MAWHFLALLLFCCSSSAEDDCGDACESQQELTFVQRKLTLTSPSQDSQCPDGIRKSFVWLSDFHLDIYYGTPLQSCGILDAALRAAHPLGVVGCDPSGELVRAAADAAATAGKEADFLVLTGDVVRHNPDRLPDPEKNVTDTIAQVSQSVALSFPRFTKGSIDVVAGTMGNDDSKINYYLDVNTSAASNAWLSTIADVLRSKNLMDEPTAESYSYGGYFEKQMGNLTLLSLNTLIYSLWHIPSSDPLPLDPLHQFSWLRERLQKAAQEKRRIWIVGHIPPGLETAGFTSLWHEEYVQRYLDIVTDPELAKWVAAQLYGHVHADEFRLLPGGLAEAGPILLIGAVSPIYESFPNFRLVDYCSSTGQLLGYQVYWANLTAEKLEWKLGYDLLQTYPSLQRTSGGLTQGDFTELATSLAKGGEEWQTYTNWYKTLLPNDLMTCNTRADLARDSCIRQYLCALTISNSSTFEECAAAYLAESVEDLNVSIEDNEYWTKARNRHWNRVA